MADTNLDKRFREYVAAIADNEIEAAVLYANYSEDERFVERTKAFHDSLNDLHNQVESQLAEEQQDEQEQADE
jgi:hypothetical protein